MSQHSRTKDERFVLKLYEIAMKKGDVGYVMSRYDVGSLIGLNSKAVDTICVLLGQANFIKKEGKDGIYLTSNGEQLALRLLSEK